MKKNNKHRRFLKHHSLSLVIAGILLILIIFYSSADPRAHLGEFFGNAIADWSGLLAMVIITKYFYEKGSHESRNPPLRLLSPTMRRLRDHSLSIFVIITGILWVVLYVRMDNNSKWGEVVGNIVSEWTQILGIIILTKHLFERHSRESKR